MIHLSPGREWLIMRETNPASSRWKVSCPVGSLGAAGVSNRHSPGVCGVVTGIDWPGW